jgi:DNA-binding transcriptional ArsR family regulator
MADKRPDWFDEDKDALLTPSALRGVVHPIRLRLLQLLQDDGPATATVLAARIGQSSGVASYHLRVLADHGFIAEDAERGNGRDRWWRPVRRSNSFTFRTDDEPADGDAEYFMRLLADDMHRRLVDYISGMSARGSEQTTELFRTGRWPLRLSAEQAARLVDDIERLLLPYRRLPGDPAATAEDGTRAVFQYQLLPDES